MIAPLVFKWVIILALLLFFRIANATIYYVDNTLSTDCTSGNYNINSGPPRTCTGSDGNAYNTVAEGTSVLHNGDTLYIRGGTYVEAIDENNFIDTGNAWDDAITVEGYQDETVIWMPNSGGETVLSFQATPVRRYMIFRNLILDGINRGGGSLDGGGAVFYTHQSSGTDHIRLDTVTLRNGDGNGALVGGSNHEFINIKVYNNGLYPGYTNSNGMYMTTDSSVIDGGEFYDNECFGVRFWDSGAGSADNNIVMNAKIYRNGRNGGPDRDIICGSGGGGINLGQVNNKAYNNIIYDGNWWGIQSQNNDSGSKYWNNTLYDNQNGVDLQESLNAEYINNISYNNDSCDLCTTGASGLTESTNLTGTNPSFANAAGGNFHLTSSSTNAIDQGTDLTSSGVTADFEGNSRPQGLAYDIGAYEFVQADTTDPVVAITAPTSSPTYATSTNPITTIAGTATDAVGTDSIAWANAATSGSGAGTGCNGETDCNWSVSSIALNEGDNAITITGTDAASNEGTDVITVTYTPPSSVTLPSAPTSVSATASSTATMPLPVTSVSTPTSGTATMPSSVSSVSATAASSPTFPAPPTGVSTP
jgi:hypothetical protein